AGVLRQVAGATVHAHGLVSVGGSCKVGAGAGSLVEIGCQLAGEGGGNRRFRAMARMVEGEPHRRTLPQGVDVGRLEREADELHRADPAAVALVAVETGAPALAAELEV